MKCIRLIPVLLLRGKRLAKGTNFGNFVDVGDPTSVAKILDCQGADELVFLDIEATNQNRKPNFSALPEMLDVCYMPISAGGGIRTIKDIHAALDAGADRVVVNTHAIEDPSFIKKGAQEFGSQCIVMSIDVKNQNGRYSVVTNSGSKTTWLDPVEFAKQAEELGAGEIIVTSIDREGTMQGYDISITRRIADAVNIPVIASGGAGGVPHLAQAVKEAHVDGVAMGTMLYLRDYDIVRIRNFLKNYGVVTRAEG